MKTFLFLLALVALAVLTVVLEFAIFIGGCYAYAWLSMNHPIVTLGILIGAAVLASKWGKTA